MIREVARRVDRNGPIFLGNRRPAVLAFWFAIANAYAGLVSLVPAVYRYDGRSYTSDGRALIWLLLWHSDTDVRRSVAWTWITDGARALGANNLAEARASFERAVDSHPSSVLGNTYLASVEASLGEGLGARARLRAIRPDSDDPAMGVWANYLAWVLALIDDEPDEADRLSALALHAFPDSEITRDTRGAVLARAGRHGDALKLLEAAEAQLTGYQLAYNLAFRAMALRGLGRLEEGHRAWMEAGAHLPEGAVLPSPAPTTTT